jgi:hypothetical protein
VLKNVTNPQQIGAILKEIGSEPDTQRIRSSLSQEVDDDKWVPAVIKRKKRKGERRAVRAGTGPAAAIIPRTGRRGAGGC